MTNNDYFIPLIQQFLAKNKGLYKESGYPYGIFIPYTMPNYSSATKKIFYVGQDTRYWTEETQYLFDGDIQKYLEINESCVDIAKTLTWGNGTGFWSFVNKLHLYINYGEIYDLRSIMPHHIETLQELGYGNMNCFELPTNHSSLAIEGWIPEMNMYKYAQLRKEGRIFDKLKHIIEAYNPDLIVILNWVEDREDIFEDLGEHWEKRFYDEDMYQSVYTLNKSKTKVLWGVHPSRINRLGISRNDLIIKYGDTINQLLTQNN